MLQFFKEISEGFCQQSEAIVWLSVYLPLKTPPPGLSRNRRTLKSPTGIIEENYARLRLMASAGPLEIQNKDHKVIWM